MFREKTLYDAFDKFMKKSLEHFSSKFNSQQFFPDVNSVSFLILLISGTKDVSKLEEYQGIQKILVNNPKLSRNFDTLVGSSNQKIRLEIPSFMESIVRNYVKKYGTAYNEEFIKREYLEIENFLLDDIITIKAEAKITSFDPNFNFQINFGDELCLQKISDYENDLASEYKHNLICYYKTPKIIGETESTTKSDDYSIIRKKILDLILILRLYRSGKIGIDDIVISESIFGGRLQMRNPSYEVSYGYPSQHYQLREEDGEKIKILSTEYEKIKKPTFLNNVINRFLSSYTQSTVEDRILDLIISLEALFLPETDELKQKLAIRTALFLETDSIERNWIYNIIRKGYDIRSQIAHGNETSKNNFFIQNKEISLNEIADLIESYSRKSIKKFIDKEIDSGKKREEIKIKLDENLFIN